MGDRPDAAELVIVGGGPVGLFAAYYAGFRGLRTVVLEALPFLGGQISTFYADSLIYDVPGFPEIRAGDLLDRLETQARGFATTEIRLGTRVTAAPLSARHRSVSWTREEDGATGVLDADATLLTTGIGRFAPQPIPDPEIEGWRDRGLHYHVADTDAYRGRRTLVAGGTQRGVELALRLADSGAEVSLIHRRDRLAVPDELRRRFASAAVRFLPHRELVGLEGGAGVERALLRDRRDQSTETLETTAVFPCFGFAAHREDLPGVEVPATDGALPVDPTMGVGDRLWAAGDAATYPGKVRVLAADFGEACTAVNNITVALFPDAPLFPGYSSHRAGEARRPK